jgi:hypothetical protein
MVNASCHVLTKYTRIKGESIEKEEHTGDGILHLCKEID